MKLFSIFMLLSALSLQAAEQFHPGINRTNTKENTSLNPDKKRADFYERAIRVRLGDETCDHLANIAQLPKVQKALEDGDKEAVEKAIRSTNFCLSHPGLKKTAYVVVGLVIYGAGAYFGWPSSGCSGCSSPDND